MATVTDRKDGPFLPQAANENGTMVEAVLFGGYTRGPIAWARGHADGLKNPGSVIPSRTWAVAPLPRVTTCGVTTASRRAGLPRCLPPRPTADTPGYPYRLHAWFEMLDSS